MSIDLIIHEDKTAKKLKSLDIEITKKNNELSGIMKELKEINSQVHSLRDFKHSMENEEAGKKGALQMLAKNVMILNKLVAPLSLEMNKK